MDEIKERIKQSWDNFICYPKGLVKKAKVKAGEKAFFETIRKERYKVHPYILPLLGELCYQGKKVLEIGCGVGSDLVNLARAGVVVTGVDLSPKSVKLARRHCQIFGVKAKLMVADAECLPFSDESFDIVYSLGVLHHSPGIQKAIAEIYRVLKPGGKVIVMLYHKNFFTYWLKLFLCRWLLTGKFLTGKFEETINDLEYPGCPWVRLYSKKGATRMFKKAGFKDISLKLYYINQGNIPLIGKLIPQPWLDFLAKYYGFHLLIKVSK